MCRKVLWHDHVGSSTFTDNCRFSCLAGFDTDCCERAEEKERQTIYNVQSVGFRDVIFRLHQFGVVRVFHRVGP